MGFVEQNSHGDETPLRTVCAVWLQAGGGMGTQETHYSRPETNSGKKRSHGESFRKLNR